MDYLAQKLSGHSHWISYLVLNNNEDLIISGSLDKTIKFWEKQIQWICSQTITDHTNSVLGLSLNDQQNQVISCGNDNLILIIKQSSQDQKWNDIQKIQVENMVEDYALSIIIYSHFNKDLKSPIIFVKIFPLLIYKVEMSDCQQEWQTCYLIWKNQNTDFITHQSIDFASNGINE